MENSTTGSIVHVLMAISRYMSRDGMTFKSTSVDATAGKFSLLVDIVGNLLCPSACLSVTWWFQELLGVYTFRSSVRPVGQTGLSDRSVRRSYRVNASSNRSERRLEESNMFDFVWRPIRLSKRVDTTSDWSDRLASQTTNHAAA